MFVTFKYVAFAFPFVRFRFLLRPASGSQYSVSQLACFWIIACAVVKVQLLWMMGFPVRFPFQFHIRFHPSMNPENDTEQSTLSTDFLCDAVRLLSTHPFRCLTCMCPAFASLHAFAVRDSFYVSPSFASAFASASVSLTIDHRMNLCVSALVCSLERR